MQIPIRLKAACICAGGLCSLMVLSSAWADNCDKINTNPAWKAGFEQMNAAYKAEDWKTALKHAKELEEICDLSPNLNYTIARIHKNSGDKEKYLYYLQKSTQNTERFKVDKDTLDRLWSEKYIAAHPEADPEAITSLHQKIDKLQAELDQVKLSTQKLESSTITKEEHLEVQINDYRTPMWIAAGIGMGGLAMAGAGAGLVGYTNKKPVEFVKNSGVPGKYKEKAMRTSGWMLIGVGSGLAVSGAIFAGIFGYKYKHFKDTQSWSLYLSPTYTSVNFEF